MNPIALILASQSPRRRALLGLLGIPFTIAAADIDETPLSGERPADMVVRLSRTKAETLVRSDEYSPDTMVLAADTMVALDGRLLGKPVDAAEAAEMLTALRGRTHQVYTAISLARHNGVNTRLSVSEVTFRNYGADEMMTYIASGDPLDKAGAYAIQHPNFAPVSRWDGCYTGIMGLPLKEVAALLEEAGFAIAHPVAEVCRSVTGQCCLDAAGESVGTGF
jgi:nucleoside triphosphate pyrophosphatase